MNKKVSRILLLLLALLSAVSIANATEQREAQRKNRTFFLRYYGLLLCKLQIG